MSFDAGKFVNNMISRFANIGKVSSNENNTKEAEKNMQSRQLFQSFDTPDEDVQIEKKEFVNNFKYGIPEQFDGGEYNDTPEEHVEMDKYAVPNLPTNKYGIPNEEKPDIVVSMYAIVKPEPTEEPPVPMYAVPEPDPTEAPVLKYAVPTFEPEPTGEIVAMYAVPRPTFEPAPTQKPTPAPPSGGSSGFIGSRWNFRQNNPWRMNLTNILGNVFSNTTTFFYNRMEGFLKDIFSRFNR